MHHCFSSLSKTLLIYLLQGDFLSLSLENNRVVLKFYLGGVSFSRLESNKSYANNSWVGIRAEREGSQGTNSCRCISGQSNKILVGFYLSLKDQIHKNFFLDHLDTVVGSDKKTHKKFTFRRKTSLVETRILHSCRVK